LEARKRVVRVELDRLVEHGERLHGPLAVCERFLVQGHAEVALQRR